MAVMKLATTTDLAGAPKKKNPYVNPAGIPGTEGADAYKAPNNANTQALSAALLNGILKQGGLTTGQVQQNAQAAGIGQPQMAQAFGNNAVAGVYQPTAVASAPASEAPAASPAVATAPGPAPRTSSYGGSGINSAGEAQARAGIAANYQNAAVQQALARRLAGYDQSKQAIEQQRARGALEATEAANATGFLTGGRNFALNGQVNAAAVNQQAGLEEQRNLAQTEASDAIARIARERGMQEIALRGELMRDDRNFGLQRDALDSTLRLQDQQYRLGEGLMPYQIGQARVGLDQSKFNLGRDQQLLPGQMTAQQLANALAGQQVRLGDAQYAENYSPTGLGYQSKQQALINAILGNKTGQAQYEDQYTPGGFGYQSREQALKGQTIANEVAQIDKGIKALELQIAQNPDYGSAAQAREQLAQLQAARQAKLQEVGSGGLTAAQQYNQLQDRKKELTDSYKVSGPAAETWLDFQDAVGDQIGGLTGDGFNNAAKELERYMSGKSLSNNEKQWVRAMFYAAVGSGAPTNLDLGTFRKDYKTTQLTQEQQQQNMILYGNPNGPG